MNLAYEHDLNNGTKRDGFCCPSKISSLDNEHGFKFCSSRQRKQQQQQRHALFDPVVEETLAKSLNGLSMSEREKIYEEIHCVGESCKEDATFIAICLDSLEEEIEKIKDQLMIQNSYDLAYNMNKQYVTNKQFRIKFLRADEYIVKNAAIRMIKHFNLKLQIFGKDKLVQDIMFDDLSKEDQDVYYAGNHQFFGSKDSKGRTVVYCFTELVIPCSWESAARVRWYQWMNALDDDDDGNNNNGQSTQMDGIVVVAIWNNRSKFDKDQMKGNKAVRESAPFKIAAMHNCIIGQNMPIYVRRLLDVIGKRCQIRSRFHLEETTTRGLYTLKSFGINPLDVPIDDNERPTLKLFYDFVEKRIKYERKHRNRSSFNKTHELLNNSFSNRKKYIDLLIASNGTTTSTTTSGSTPVTNTDMTAATATAITTSYIPMATTTDSTSSITETTNSNNNNNNNNDSNIIIPTNHDILLGKGDGHKFHRGNVLLDEIVNKKFMRHRLNLTNFEKICEVYRILHDIKTIHGGRFLKRRGNKNSGQWYIVDDNTAQKSISAKFRNKARKKK